MSRGKITDSSFKDWLQLEDGAENNWLAKQIALGFPITLPWKRQKIRLGTCFQSRLLANDSDPWLSTNPFILSDLYLIPKILRSEYGSTSTFHSVNTSQNSETTEHLSLGFGMGTGLPFLCSASVKGTYDEEVKKNNDSDKSSIRASVRNATVQLERNPRLSHEAMVMLKYGGGYQAFTKEFGDYFVWGYRLGGDTGLMLSSSSFTNERVDTYSIKATVEVLILEDSTTWTKDFHTFNAGKRMSFVGYDTLSNQNWNATTAGSGIQALSAQAEAAMRDSSNILGRVLRFLEEHSMADGDDLTHEQCDLLASNGVAVELVLLPMSSMRDVARWTTEHDII